MPQMYPLSWMIMMPISIMFMFLYLIMVYYVMKGFKINIKLNLYTKKENFWSW